MNFNYKKITQIINLLAILEMNANSKSIDKLKTFKLIFFIDRYFLRNFGQLVTGDTYFAMNLGPVPSGVKDVFEVNDNFTDEQKEYIISYLKLDGYNIQSKNNLDSTFLSKIELETIEKIYNEFGGIKSDKLVDLTHLYPEWKKHEETVKNFGRCEMNIEDFFENTIHQEKLFEQSEESLEETKEIFKENYYIEECFR